MKNCYFRYERLSNECNGSNDLINERDNNFIFYIILRSVKICVTPSLVICHDFIHFPKF